MKTLEQIAYDLNLQGSEITEDFAIIYNHGLYNDMKTNTQHTPGPWKLAAGVIGPDKVWMEDSQGNETMICRGVENEHDAALIAAAPELLAALDRFIPLCNQLAVALTEEHVSESIKNLTQHCHQARTAITKATGKE